MNFLDQLSELYGEDECEQELSEFESGLEHIDICQIQDGDKFTVHGIEFIRLGKEQGGVLCVGTKESSPISYFHIRRNNNYKDSTIREVLKSNILDKLDGFELLPYEMDLTALNGEKQYGTFTDKIGILTLDLFRKYRDYLLPFDDYFWTCTPYSCSPDNPYVALVSSSGHVYGSYAYNAYRCRPACIFPE